MEVAKVTSKGQITIPISIRRRLEINEGDKVLFIYKSEGVMMVNPNNMQSGIDEDVVETADKEISAANETAKSEPKLTAPEMKAPPATETGSEDEKAVVAATETTQAVPRPVPPPIEEPEKPDTHVGGFNLNTLLDDIRSIGSNI